MPAEMDAPTAQAEIPALDIYKAHCAKAQSAVDSLYKMPPIFSTIIGGLWYFASQQAASRPLMAAAVFLFAAAVGLAASVALWRNRMTMNGYLDSVQRFEGPYGFSLRGRSRLPSVTRTFIAMLLFSGALSVAGAIAALASAA